MLIVAVVLGAYLLGSLPSGYITVRLFTGKDVRDLQSGRTGGTNAMRAAGLVAGLITAFADISKGAVAVWMARSVLPGIPLAHVAAGLAAVVGHNFSVFLVRREEGTLKFGGGAGGAPTVGAAIGIWAPSGLLIVPIGALILYFLGYASVATMTIGVLATLIFLVRGALGIDPMAYIWLGVGAEFLLIWSLRPNIKRLIEGNERLVGLRARRLKESEVSS